MSDIVSSEVKMDREFSEEEDDRENLIESNERKMPKTSFEIGDIKSKVIRSLRFNKDQVDRAVYEEQDDQERLMEPNQRKVVGSAFEIGEYKNKIFRVFSSNKRYLFAICLPIFFLVVYFSVDIGNLFRGFSSVRMIGIPNDRMREAELKALYLLREQHLELLNLWNITSNDLKLGSRPNANSSLNSNSTGDNKVNGLSSLMLLEDFRSAVLKQIKLNKEVQQVLLSSHRVGNWSGLENDNADVGFGNYGLSTCRKVEEIPERRTIEWNPKSNKFLFAICLSGQMSNHLICLEKHMFFAALLDRVLVIPSPKVDYQYNRVLDIDHINKCFGRKVVVTFEEFSELKKNHIHIDRFICYVSLPQPCFADEEHVKKLKSLGISMGSKLEPAWVEDVRQPKKRTIEEVKSKFSSNENVLAIGDVFYADVEQEWVMQPGGPLAHKCRTLVEPSRLIMLTAQRFIQTFLGQNFVALQFRRHGFLKFCNAKKTSCFFPIPQAADCISRVVEKADAPVVYLSTDAAESETDLLQSLIVPNRKTVPLVKRPARNSAEKWDALLYRHGLEGDSQVEAMLDKTICAMSSVFIGSSGSTFTEDIIRLRKDWRSASSCDEYLCQSEQPDFIAENE